MGRGKLPAAKGRPKAPERKAKNPRGIHVIVRDGFWHVHGTLRVQGQSIRVRKTLGIPASRPEEDAIAARNKIENDLINQVIHGIKPDLSFAEAALRYLEKPRRRALGPRSLQIVKEVSKHFGLRSLSAINSSAIADYVRLKHAGKKAESAERYLTALYAVLRYAHRMEWIDRVPHVERDKAARGHKRQPNKGYLLAKEIELLVDCSADHLRPLLATLASAGSRVTETLYVPIKNFDLTRGQARFLAEDTKNGTSRWCTINDWAAAILEKSFRRRTDRDAPAFLTQRGVPYSQRATETGCGGQIKQGFATAASRAAAIIADKWKTPDRARLVRKATPHWLRHSMASDLAARGVGIKTLMDAGGWLDTRSVTHYLHGVPDAVRSAIDARGLGKTPRPTRARSRR